jgi:hypothetical protein
MGWVRFLLAAAALPAILAGVWLVFHWQSQTGIDPGMPLLTTAPLDACEAFQAAAVSTTLTAERQLDDAPARAYAAAADAFVASELAAAVCDPADWADPKLRSRPPELQNAAYSRLADGAISGFETACAALDESVLAEDAYRDLLTETGQSEYARWLKDSAAAYVCSDRPRHRIGPAASAGPHPLFQSNLIAVSARH